MIDLDKILSLLHCVTLDPERKAHVGDTEISITEVETIQKVETSSEWSTAWQHQEKGNFLFGILRHLLILSNAFGGFFYFYVLSKFSKSSYK